MAGEDTDFFGKIGDVFGGIFDTVEEGYNRWLNLQWLKEGGYGAGYGYNEQPVVTQQPVQAAPSTAYPSGSGPFFGVPTETMVLIAGGALVLLVLLRR
ncbi:hypothetical protein [Parvibaculum sp.]|uniref:hypothetical protein n=1 Tax=Parvibaculum sp. TaxID=2024848 RepID=UPI00391C2FFF